MRVTLDKGPEHLGQGGEKQKPEAVEEDDKMGTEGNPASVAEDKPANEQLAPKQSTTEGGATGSGGAEPASSSPTKTQREEVVTSNINQKKEEFEARCAKQAQQAKGKAAASVKKAAGKSNAKPADKADKAQNGKD